MTFFNKKMNAHSRSVKLGQILSSLFTPKTNEDHKAIPLSQLCDGINDCYASKDRPSADEMQVRKIFVKKSPNTKYKKVYSSHLSSS